MRALIFAFALAACAQQAPAPSEVEACAAGEHEQVVATMYFGRNIGAELGVSEEEWDAFVDEVVTPRFPDGLTVTDVDGQYRGDNDVLVHEPSKVLTVVTDAAGQAALAEIAAAYRERFQQESVMAVVERSCVAFLSGSQPAQ